MTKTKKQTKHRIPNFTVQSGDLKWKGYATREDIALRKAFDSFKKGALAELTRFQRTGQSYFYIATEAAIARAGLKFKEYVSQ